MPGCYRRMNEASRRQLNVRRSISNTPSVATWERNGFGWNGSHFNSNQGKFRLSGWRKIFRRCFPSLGGLCGGLSNFVIRDAIQATGVPPKLIEEGGMG